MSSKAKTILAISITIIFAITAVTYYHFKKKGEAIVEKVGLYLSKKTGRKIEIGSITYSPLDGLLLRDVAIKERDEKTDFFKFKKAEIKINEKEFIKGNLLFDKARFYDGKIRFERRAGVWNFSDLMQLLPPSKKPVHLVWNAKEFSFDNFDFYLTPLQEEKGEISIIGASFSLSHRSSTGGNFSISLKGPLGALISEKLFSCKLGIRGELNYDYSSLKSAVLKTDLKNIFYDQISADTASFSGEFFDLNRKGPKNFRAQLYLKNFFIPSSDANYRYFLKKLENVEKALGRNILKENEFSLDEFKASILVRDSSAEITSSLDSNLIFLDFSSYSNLAEKRDEIKAELKSGKSKINLEAVSDFSKVSIKQEFSETASQTLKNSILDFEKEILLKIIL